MKTLYETLTILHAAISANIPALLAGESLTDFSVYKIGGSRNAKETGLFVYQDELGIAYDRESISIILQLQLYNVDGITAAKYTDIVSEYIRDYAPDNIGLDMLDQITIDSWPIDQTATTFVYMNCTWSSELDSCDNL